MYGNASTKQTNGTSLSIVGHLHEVTEIPYIQHLACGVLKSTEVITNKQYIKHCNLRTRSVLIIRPA
jgi:hypothetical protein